jgi:hypothetical protein
VTVTTSDQSTSPFIPLIFHPASFLCSQVRFRVHAYCHDVGVVGNPFPPGARRPKGGP